jgi:hypothetical protein
VTCLPPFLRFATAACAGLLVVVSLPAADLSSTTGAAVLPPEALQTEEAGARDDASVPESMNDESDYISFLKPGEKLVFRASWGIFSTAGHMEMVTTRETSAEGEPLLHVHINTQTKGLISAFFPVDSNADSWIDPATGRPIRVERSGREGDREAHATTVYDYEEHRVVHTDHNRPKRSGETDLPDEPAYDTFVAMMLARTWDLQVGEKRRVFSSFEDDIYEIEATGIEEDKIKTPYGKFEVVEIEMKQIGEQKGFFKKGGEARFFISRGDEPQIVRIELRAKAGTFVMQLVEVEQVPEASTAAAN